MTQGSARIVLDAFPLAVRPAVWADGLSALFLTPSMQAGSGEGATLSVRRSVSGARLGLVRGEAQTLTSACRVGAMHGLIQVIAGRGRLEGAGRGLELGDGALAAVDMAQDWTLRWNGSFECLVLDLPGERLASRLGRGAPELPLVLGGSLAGAGARPLMRMIAASIDDMSQADLTSLETAVVELAASAILAERDAKGETEVQAAHLRRITAAIEARLGEPDLSLAEIARREQLAPRYLQKLFERGGESFSDHLRRRRLERCAVDLADPAHAEEAISSIAWRWGFRDQAHFSRAFGAHHGQSPRDYRRLAALRAETVERLNRGRPPRDRTGAPSAGGPAGRERAPPVLTPPARPAALPARETGPGGRHHHLPATPDTVRWGYVGRSIPPILRVESGDVLTVETLTQHGCDDADRLIRSDPAAEAVFEWTSAGKRIERRGAGPMNASIFGRGAGEGFGVHICTGPVFVSGAEPGDVLEIEILDLAPRPSANPAHPGKAFASNVSAWWGYQYHDPVEGAARREVVTIYEIDLADPTEARALYSYVWQPQTDPSGVRHETLDYPGIPLDRATIAEVPGVLPGVRVPARPHFGFVAVAPREAELVDTVPPGYFGGNIDNWRAGPGSRLFLPVAVPGALLSVGDGHFAQGDGEVNGTGLECSLTGTLRLRLHKRADPTIGALAGLAAPLIETETAFVVQGFSYANYLKELGRDAQTEVYSRSTLDLAMRDAFRRTRRFLMDGFGLREDEALSLMSVAVDFAVTQVADGNFGIHATIPKSLFS